MSRTAEAIRAGLRPLATDPGMVPSANSIPRKTLGGLLRVEVRADAPEPLLGGQVGGDRLGRAGRQRGAGGRHRLPALRRELGIGGDRELERDDLVPQAGEPNGGIGEVRLDRALARPRRQRGDPRDDRGVRLEDRREEQRRLVREVAVDRPLGDAGRLGDRPGRGVGVADLADDAARRLDESRPGGLASLRSRPHLSP